MERRKILYLAVIIFNLASLYFIIDLLSYDEIVGYVLGGRNKISDPKDLACLLYITSLLNLYFLSFVVMKDYFKDGL